jgi:hypothetical protein
MAITGNPLEYGVNGCCPYSDGVKRSIVQLKFVLRGDIRQPSLVPEQRDPSGKSPYNCIPRPPYI